MVTVIIIISQIRLPLVVKGKTTGRPTDGNRNYSSGWNLFIKTDHYIDYHDVSLTIV